MLLYGSNSFLAFIWFMNAYSSILKIGLIAHLVPKIGMVKLVL